jgi:flavodoxin
MASSKKAAQEMQQALEGEGILVKLRNVSSKSKDGRDTYEILVLESEASQAREILLENGLL